MRAVVVTSCWRSCLRVAAVGALAAGVAACSADTTRFSDPNSNPFAYNGNPFASPSVPAEVTGSMQTAPASQISAQSLPPPAASHPVSVAATGVSGGGPGIGAGPGNAPGNAPGMGSYNPAP